MNANDRAKSLVEHFKEYPESGFNWMVPYIEKHIREVQAEQKERDAKIADKFTGVIAQTIGDTIREQEDGE